MGALLNIDDLAGERGGARLLLPGPQTLLYREHQPAGLCAHGSEVAPGSTEGL